MTRIPLMVSTFGQEEIDAAVDVLRSSFVTMGAKCLEFEDSFAAYVGARHAVFVNSGSSANLLAFFALANPAISLRNGHRKLERGAEVIVPAVTWSTTIWPIVQAGGIPVLVDSDPQTLQMDLDSVKKAIGPNTVGICPVHVLGNAVPMEPILRLAAENGLWVVEDACEAVGTRHRGKQVGTFGNMGTYSFFMSHQITTIEGGMVVTDDDDHADLLRCLRAHGWSRNLRNRKAIEARHPTIDSRFLFVNTGFNLRPTEVSAVFGLQQLKKLDAFNRRRVESCNAWNAAFEPLFMAGLLTPIHATQYTQPAWFSHAVVCQSKQMCEALQAHLEGCGIETRPIICGNIARQPAFEHIVHRIPGPLTGADRIMDCGLYWGSSPRMTDADIDYVSQSVQKFFANQFRDSSLSSSSKRTMWQPV